jgi:hypothetical protein
MTRRPRVFPTNQQRLAPRVNTARRALAEYNADAEPYAALKGILADLRHFADAERLNFGDIDKDAYRLYLSERGDAQGD